MIIPLTSDSKIRELELLGQISIAIEKRTGVKIEDTTKVITGLIDIMIENDCYYEDEKWPYWDRNDSNNAPGKNQMLKMNFAVEQGPGIVLHIDLRKKYKL